MAKIHLHTNQPERLFDCVRQFSRDPVLKKEKVDDMFAMRDRMHGVKQSDLGDSTFTIVGLGGMLLPDEDDFDGLFTLPVFLVPATTQEPVDMRFVTDSDTCNALNMQRHNETAIQYTTAASNPMQIKIELLAALGKGKPVLVLLMNKDKRISAMGRNVVAAVDMLSPSQKEQVRVCVHGWGFADALLTREAIRLAREGRDIDYAYSACKRIGDRNVNFINFAACRTVRFIQSRRPGLFPDGFTVEDGQYTAFGPDASIRDGEPLTEFQRVGLLMNVQNSGPSISALQDLEVDRIKRSLKPGQRLASPLVPCVGRPDYGYQFVDKLKAAGVSCASF